MNIKSVCSTKNNEIDAVKDLKSQLEGFNTKMIVFFASCDAYKSEEISKSMADCFPNIDLCGCSSKSEIYDTKAPKNSIVAMAFNDKCIEDVKVEVLENIKSEININSAFKSFEAHFNIDMDTVDYKKYGGIVLVDGLSCKEEEIMDKIGDHTNVMFTGASASDDMKFQKTYVYAHGKAYTNAALLVLFKTKNGVDYLKTQSVKVSDKILTVTKANAATRTVIEFNNKPAIQAYAEALGIPKEKVEEHFFSHPLGLVVESSVYIRSAQKVDGESIVFYCSILEGMELNICSIEDIVSETNECVKNKLKELGKIEGIIDFQCVLRTIQLENENKMNEYGNIFNSIPTIGFSTFGEQFLGHMNQTSTMIIFR